MENEVRNVQALNIEIETELYHRLEKASDLTNFTKKAILVEALSNWLMDKFPKYEKAFQEIQMPGKVAGGAIRTSDSIKHVGT